MEWYEKEERWEKNLRQGRIARDIWKYIPKKIEHAVDGVSVNSAGYWIYLKDGFRAYDGAEDCGQIHEYLISDLKDAIKTIREYKK